jgi:hypothetical protein
MTEGTPTTPGQFRRLNRDLMEKVLDKAASDPEWKQRLLDDPEVAIGEAGFPEAQRLQQMQEANAGVEEAEVTGQELPRNPPYTYGAVRGVCRPYV